MIVEILQGLTRDQLTREIAILKAQIRAHQETLAAGRDFIKELERENRSLRNIVEELQRVPTQP